jgi:hypothetical protein
MPPAAVLLSITVSTLSYMTAIYYIALGLLYQQYDVANRICDPEETFGLSALLSPISKLPGPNFRRYRAHAKNAPQCSYQTLRSGHCRVRDWAALCGGFLA